MDLKTQFKKSTEEVKKLPPQSNERLLEFYALYKQATEGDITGSRPGFLDLKGRAKFDAWSKLKGTDTQKAMQQYIDLVSKLS